MCEFCGQPGHDWSVHAEARAEVAAAQREARAQEFPFGDHTHDAEVVYDFD